MGATVGEERSRSTAAGGWGLEVGEGFNGDSQVTTHDGWPDGVWGLDRLGRRGEI